MSLELAERSYKAYKIDLLHYSHEVEKSIHNPALVALERIFLGRPANTEQYIERRIQIERSQKRR